MTYGVAGLLGLSWLMLTASIADADQLADVRRAFWERVHCVQVFASAEIGEDRNLSKAVGRDIALRLLTVWRREMPDFSMARAYSSEDLETLAQPEARSKLMCPIVLSGSRRWNPSVKVRIRAGRMDMSDLWYGVVTTSFEMSLEVGILKTEFLCTDVIRDSLRKSPFSGVIGPTYRSEGDDRRLFSSLEVDLAFFNMVRGQSDPIFANLPKTRITDVAQDAGEKMIKGIASSYYEVKASVSGQPKP